MSKNNKNYREPVSWSAPPELLAFLDRAAKKEDLDRSQLITRYVRLGLAAELAKNPFFWEKLYESYFNKANEDN